jgi:16S rRNA (guanine966-N2)-methyltransferase
MRVISGEARGHNLKAPKGMTTRPMADKIKGAVFSMLSTLLDQMEQDWGRVLDLYAGSGSIGIEALSRGASWVDFVEINAGVCRVISENLEHTKFMGRARVNNRQVNSFLNSPPAAPGSAHAKRAAGGLHRRKGGEKRDKETIQAGFFSVEAAQVEIAPVEPPVSLSPAPDEKFYDIIFLDPPYADPKIPDTLEHVARSGLIKPGGLVVIGHSPRVTLAAVIGSEQPGDGVQLNLLRHRRHGDSAFTIFLAGNPSDYGFKQEETETEAETEGLQPGADEDTIEADE